MLLMIKPFKASDAGPQFAFNALNLTLGMIRAAPRDGQHRGTRRNGDERLCPVHERESTSFFR